MPKLAKNERVPEITPAQGTQRRRVGLLLGCVQREFFPQVNAATARVLAAEGCEVIAPKEQPCCGALMVHAGEEDGALALARKTIEAFERANVDTDRHQRRGLRLKCEGIRPSASRRSQLRRSRQSLRRKMQGHHRSSNRTAAARHKKSPAHARRVPRLLSPAARARRPLSTPPIALARFPASSSLKSLKAPSAAAPQASTISSSPTPPTPSAIAKPNSYPLLTPTP